ncbi:MAG TPA: DNA cytosine methyltransferase [Arcobacter sp.]|nr:DNA cytosine methyltransferase [Arcobacter sp.]
MTKSYKQETLDIEGIDSKAVEKSSYYWEHEPTLNKKDISECDNKYNLVDLFCGAGGISCGFHMTNKFQTILANDIYIPALKTYEHNNEHTPTILGDVRKITPEMYQDMIGDNKVHVVSAGVPCQGFSLSNKKRHANDERNFLFLEVVKFINIYNPDIVMIENVSGMKSLNKGSFVDEIKTSLEDAGEKGYTVIEPRLLNAANYGVPQLRNRLIFLAVRNGLPNINYPIPEFGTESNPYRTIEDAIGDLPELANHDEKNKYSKKKLKEYQNILRGNQKELLNHKSPKHPQSTVDRIAKTEPSKPMYENYKQRIRLSWSIQSPTQVAGGIRPQFQFGHPSQDRGLSIRERARIQSFPDNYYFTGGIVQGRVQTGNAVPPLLAKAIGREIVKVLDKHYGNKDKNYGI